MIDECEPAAARKQQVNVIGLLLEPHRLGEAEGLKISLADATDKLAQIDRRLPATKTVDLGIPAINAVLTGNP